jgi:uncharacterized protein YbjQ (UPF0145 family)
MPEPLTLTALTVIFTISFVKSAGLVAGAVVGRNLGQHLVKEVGKVWDEEVKRYYNAGRF